MITTNEAYEAKLIVEYRRATRLDLMSQGFTFEEANAILKNYENN